MSMNASRIERLMRKIELVPFTTCWIWTGACFSNGYGNVKVPNQRKNQVAHRAVYEEIKGPVDKSLVLDHLCKNKFCVNPDHLEAVSQKENLDRAGTIDKLRKAAKIRGQKLNCKRGHELSGANLYIQSNGGRRCLACSKITNKANIDAKKSVAK